MEAERKIMNILNFTPHDVNILREECTVQQRSGKIVLRQDCSLNDALIASIKPESKPLSITPDGGIDLVCDKLPFYSSISRAQDNYGFSASLLNNNPGSCSFLFDSQFEMADVIIVNQRCANYINAKIPFIQLGQQDETHRLNLLDKFYIPFNIVYPNRRPDSASQGFTGYKPISTLGLQKVSGYLNLSFYALAIKMNLAVSIPGLCCAAMAYTSMPAPLRSNEYDLQVVNDYLIKHGYTPYPELFFRQ